MRTCWNGCWCTQGELSTFVNALGAAEERARDAEQALSLNDAAYRGCRVKFRQQHELRQQAHQHRLEQIGARRRQVEAEQQQVVAALAAEHSAHEQDQHWQAAILGDLRAGQGDSSAREASDRQMEQPDVTLPMQSRVAGTQISGRVSAPAHSSAGAGRPAMLETQRYPVAMAQVQHSQQDKDSMADEQSSPALAMSHSSSKENRDSREPQAPGAKQPDSQAHSSLQASVPVAVS